MKIIMHLVESPGGVERYLYNLLTILKNNHDYENILVCSSKYDYRKFIKLVSNIEIINCLHNDISLIYDILSVFSVRKIIKKYNPDVIYCHSSKAGAIGRIANIGLCKTVIYNPHGWAFSIKSSSSYKTKLYEFIERLLAPFADKIVCISEYEKKIALERKICNEDKLIVINNGINFLDCKLIRPKTREDLNIPKNAFVVGTIGRLSPQKAPDMFIEMSRLIKRKVPNSFFLMVGDDIGNGFYRTKYELLIEKYSLDSCFLITGWVDNPLDYLCVFDVAVLLSRWEGFGLVLPEYMMLEKPIVTTKADAIPFVVGDAGLLVDIDDFVQAAESVIQIYEDSKLREMLVIKGKERVNLFDINKTAEEHVKMFNTLSIRQFK